MTAKEEKYDLIYRQIASLIEGEDEEMEQRGRGSL